MTLIPSFSLSSEIKHCGIPPFVFLCTTFSSSILGQGEMAGLGFLRLWTNPFLCDPLDPPLRVSRLTLLCFFSRKPRQDVSTVHVLCCLFSLRSFWAPQHPAPVLGLGKGGVERLENGGFLTWFFFLRSYLGSDRKVWFSSRSFLFTSCFEQQTFAKIFVSYVE